MLIYFPVHVARGKYHKGFSFRFGFLPKEFKTICRGKKNIWIHAVSVGEVLAIVDLVAKLKQALPYHHIICTTVTKTGYKIACDQLPKSCSVLFAPLDFSWVVKKYINVICPQIYLSVETEIWPNLYHALHARKVPIMLINGRISDKSFKKYKRLKSLLKGILGDVTLFLMQSQMDADRIIHLGADSNRVRVLGNVKFDNLPSKVLLEKRDLGFEASDELLIAGSTHPGEEEILIDVYKALLSSHPHLRLILTPRHVERSEEIVSLVQSHGFEPVRFSQLNQVVLTARSMVIVDEIGHLRELYSLAKLVFVGKSLCGEGGQNVIEPAFFGKPVFVGPHTYNFKDIMEIFLREKAIVQIQNADELLSVMQKLLNDPTEFNHIGHTAQKIVERYQGSTRKTVEEIVNLISSG